MAWLDWLLPSTCPLCQRPGDGNSCFCQDCALLFPPPAPDIWKLSHSAEADVPIYTWGRYEGALRRSIQLLKYRHQERIGETFGGWLGRYWLQTSPRREYLVIPIPLHRDRLKLRGYNQAEIASRAFCHTVKCRHAPELLRRPKATAAQFGLNRSQRLRNLQHAFAASPKLASVRQPVLLFDDIYTTGATVAAARTAIERACPQVEIVGVIAIARAMPTEST